MINPDFNPLQPMGLCGTCRTTWPDTEPRDKCPACGLEFQSHGMFLVAARVYKGELTEPYLFGRMYDAIGRISGPEELQRYLGLVTSFLGLEPQSDLSAVELDVTDTRLQQVWVRTGHGQHCVVNLVRLLPEDSVAVMLIQDGHRQLYVATCAPRLLLGWRASVGDA